MVILTTVDCFSKSVHFVPLPKLPFSLKTVNVLVLHLFHLHGLPQGIFLTGGPQFASQVWKAFCQALGASASLSLLVTTFRPMARGSGQTKIWGHPYDV